jgi:hypothetical protein
VAAAVKSIEPTYEVVNAKDATANEAAAAVEPVVLRLPKLIAVESLAYLGAPSGYRVPRVQPGKGTSANGHGVNGKRTSEGGDMSSPPGYEFKNFINTIFLVLVFLN